MLRFHHFLTRCAVPRLTRSLRSRGSLSRLPVAYTVLQHAISHTVEFSFGFAPFIYAPRLVERLRSRSAFTRTFTVLPHAFFSSHTRLRFGFIRLVCIYTVLFWIARFTFGLRFELYVVHSYAYVVTFARTRLDITLPGLLLFCTFSFCLRRCAPRSFLRSRFHARFLHGLRVVSRFLVYARLPTRCPALFPHTYAHIWFLFTWICAPHILQFTFPVFGYVAFVVRLSPLGWTPRLRHYRLLRSDWRSHTLLRFLTARTTRFGSGSRCFTRVSFTFGLTNAFSFRIRTHASPRFGCSFTLFTLPFTFTGYVYVPLARFGWLVPLLAFYALTGCPHVHLLPATRSRFTFHLRLVAVAGLPRSWLVAVRFTLRLFARICTALVRSGLRSVCVYVHVTFRFGCLVHALVHTRATLHSRYVHTAPFYVYLTVCHVGSCRFGSVRVYGYLRFMGYAAHAFLLLTLRITPACAPGYRIRFLLHVCCAFGYLLRFYSGSYGSTTMHGFLASFTHCTFHTNTVCLVGSHTAFARLVYTGSVLAHLRTAVWVRFRLVHWFTFASHTPTSGLVSFLARITSASARFRLHTHFHASLPFTLPLRAPTFFTTHTFHTTGSRIYGLRSHHTHTARSLTSRAFLCLARCLRGLKRTHARSFVFTRCTRFLFWLHVLVTPARFWVHCTRFARHGLHAHAAPGCTHALVHRFTLGSAHTCGYALVCYYSAVHCLRAVLFTVLVGFVPCSSHTSHGSRLPHWFVRYLQVTFLVLAYTRSTVGWFILFGWFPDSVGLRYHFRSRLLRFSSPRCRLTRYTPACGCTVHTVPPGFTCHYCLHLYFAGCSHCVLHFTPRFAFASPAHWFHLRVSLPPAHFMVLRTHTGLRMQFARRFSPGFTRFWFPVGYHTVHYGYANTTGYWFRLVHFWFSGLVRSSFVGSFVCILPHCSSCGSPHLHIHWVLPTTPSLVHSWLPVLSALWFFYTHLRLHTYTLPTTCWVLTPLPGSLTPTFHTHGSWVHSSQFFHTAYLYLVLQFTLVCLFYPPGYIFRILQVCALSVLSLIAGSHLFRFAVTLHTLTRFYTARFWVPGCLRFTAFCTNTLHSHYGSRRTWIGWLVTFTFARYALPVCTRVQFTFSSVTSLRTCTTFHTAHLFWFASTHRSWMGPHRTSPTLVLWLHIFTRLISPHAHAFTGSLVHIPLPALLPRSTCRFWSTRSHVGWLDHDFSHVWFSFCWLRLVFTHSSRCAVVSLRTVSFAFE